MNLLINQKETRRLRKRTHDCWRKGIVRDLGKVMTPLLYLKYITNKDLLYSTENSAQCYVAAWIGSECRGEWMHVYVWLSPFAVHDNLGSPETITLLIGYAAAAAAAKSLQSCPTLSDPMDCSLPGSSIHGIFQA